MQDRLLQIDDSLPDPVAAEVEVAANVAGSEGAAVDASTAGITQTAGDGLQQADVAASQSHMLGPQCFHAYNPSTLESYQQVGMLHTSPCQLVKCCLLQACRFTQPNVLPPVAFQQWVECLALCDVTQPLKWLAMEALSI